MSTHLQFEVLVTGRGLLEGPCVDAEDRLYFSDTRKGGIFRARVEIPGLRIELAQV
jgi:sugar lactone lactonase YvrE